MPQLWGDQNWRWQLLSPVDGSKWIGKKATFSTGVPIPSCTIINSRHPQQTVSNPLLGPFLLDCSPQRQPYASGTVPQCSIPPLDSIWSSFPSNTCQNLSISYCWPWLQCAPMWCLRMPLRQNHLWRPIRGTIWHISTLYLYYLGHRFNQIPLNFSKFHRMSSHSSVLHASQVFLN